MQEFSEKVLILRVGRFREADAWVRFLSPTRGVITAFAFGGCNSRRRFCGCLDPFNEVLFKVKSNKNGAYLNLEEGVLTHAPRKLRTDPQRLGLAVNCIKFAEAAMDPTDSCTGTYGLLTSTLHVLDSVDTPSSLVPILFRARVAFEHGLWPQLRSCGECGAPIASARGATHNDNGGGRFLVEQGHIVCHNCRPHGRGLSLPVSGAAVEVLALVRDSSPEAWQHVNLPTHARRECATVVDHFVRYHLGLAWERGAFRRI